MPQAATRKFPFKMGADPEFNFTIQNKQTARLRADSLMKEFFSDKSVSGMGYNVPGGNCGWDGNAATAELRPKPENSPKALANNLGKMYKEIVKNSPRAIKMSLMSNLAPVGGHIHFELDDVSRNMSDAKARVVCKKLSTFYIPILLGESKSNALIRLQTSYGRFSDWRREGSQPTYEYRTPSAEWQCSERIATATLAYMGCVWNEAVHHPKSFTKCAAIYTNDRMGDAIQNLVARDYAPIKDALTNDLIKTIKTFEYYEMFKEEIDYIMNFRKVLKDKEDAEFCINNGWNLGTAISATKKTFNNEAKINKELKDMDVDRWLALFNIPFNPDNNVGEFVDALKKRILAFDMTMKNNYFMFGMRKGVDKPIIMDSKGWLAGGAQIKTKRDSSVIKDTFDRMMGKCRRTGENNIIIGLPYKDRMERNVRPVMDLIYGLERMPEKFAPVNVATQYSRLVDDRESPVEGLGAIAKAYSKSASTEELVDRQPRPNFSPMDEVDESDEDCCPNCGAANHDCDC